MTWIIFVLGAVLSWGIYGPMLHKGQLQLGNPLRALLCVGVAYFLVGVLVPVIVLGAQGQLNGFNSAGTTAATLAGTLGALGAVFIIFSYRYGGIPVNVMPLVFGGAPVVNVIYTMMIHPPKNAPSPMFYDAEVGHVPRPLWRRDDPPEMCRPQLAVHTRRNRLRRELELRKERQHLGNHQHPPCLLSGGHHSVSGLRIDGDRFLNQHMLARFQRSDHCLLVTIIGKANVDQVNRRIKQHLLESVVGIDLLQVQHRTTRPKVALN